MPNNTSLIANIFPKDPSHIAKIWKLFYPLISEKSNTKIDFYLDMLPICWDHSSQYVFNKDISQINIDHYKLKVNVLSEISRHYYGKLPKDIYASI